MTWCWVIPIMVGLVSALLGYLMGMSGKRREINEWKAKLESLDIHKSELDRKVILLEKEMGKAHEMEQRAKEAYDELIGRFNLLQREWDKNRTAIQNLKDENDELRNKLRE